MHSTVIKIEHKHTNRKTHCKPKIHWLMYLVRYEGLENVSTNFIIAINKLPIWGNVADDFKIEKRQALFTKGLSLSFQ